VSGAAAAEAAPAPKGKKKLLVIVAAAVLLLGGGGAAALMMKKKSGAEAEADAPAKPKAAAVAKRDASTPPTFVPLDPFTVNLADRESERYAQIAITLEIDDAKLGEQIKIYMPAIRNNVLMAIADRSAGELMGRDGKALLATRIARETSRALGYAVPDDDEEEDEEAADKKPKKKKKKAAPAPLPIRAVHFSNFIIQ
jgi:flagellar protein FliL